MNFFLRLLAAGVVFYLGLIAGALTYEVPFDPTGWSDTHHYLPLVLGDRLWTSIFVPWLLPVHLLTGIVTLVFLFTRSPRWLVVFLYLGAGLLVFGADYSIYETRVHEDKNEDILNPSP